MAFRVINGVMYPIGSFPVAEQKNNSKVNLQDVKSGQTFEDILKSKIHKNETFSISKHAAERLQNIDLTKEDMKTVNEAINRAQEKGAKN